MNTERALSLILKFHLSEKVTQDNRTKKGRVYCFRVLKDANKLEIRQAVEELFQVKVLSLSTANVKSKRLIRSGKKSGCRKAWKKTYVTLHVGNQIDMLEQ